MLYVAAVTAAIERLAMDYEMYLSRRLALFLCEYRGMRFNVCINAVGEWRICRFAVMDVNNTVRQRMMDTAQKMAAEEEELRFELTDDGDFSCFMQGNLNGGCRSITELIESFLRVMMKYSPEFAALYHLTQN